MMEGVPAFTVAAVARLKKSNINMNMRTLTRGIRQLNSKKTPGEPGRTRDTQRHTDRTDEPHNHPNPQYPVQLYVVFNR